MHRIERISPAKLIFEGDVVDYYDPWRTITIRAW